MFCWPRRKKRNNSFFKCVCARNSVNLLPISSGTQRTSSYTSTLKYKRFSTRPDRKKQISDIEKTSDFGRRFSGVLEFTNLLIN